MVVMVTVYHHCDIYGTHSITFLQWTFSHVPMVTMATIHCWDANLIAAPSSSLQLHGYDEEKEEAWDYNSRETASTINVTQHLDLSYPLHDGAIDLDRCIERWC